MAKTYKTPTTLGLTTPDQIKAWQAEYKLPQTGTWGETEEKAYKAYKDSPYKTADEIKLWQLQHGLNPTGKWTSADDKAWRKDVAEAAHVTDINNIARRVMAEYNLPSTDAEYLRTQIESYLRPAADQAIEARNKQTAASRAAIDLDAYSRGMGASTWVTDAKQRETDSAADDIGNIESNYMSTLSEAVLNQLNQNRNINLNAQNNAYTLAQQLYQSGQEATKNVAGSSGSSGSTYIYLGGLADSSGSSSGSGGSSSGKGSSSSSSSKPSYTYDSSLLPNAPHL